MSTYAAPLADQLFLMNDVLGLEEISGLPSYEDATPDLVAGVAQHKRPQQRIIAFALEEPAQLESRAIEKMHRKGVDAIVANALNAMEAADIDAVLLTSQGSRRSPGPMSKTDFAPWLIDKFASLAELSKNEPRPRGSGLDV